MKILVVVLFCLSVCSFADDVGYFFHLADIHYDSEYKAGGDPYYRCTKVTPGVSGASVVGNYHCDVSPTMFESALDFLSNLPYKPEFVLWTGDAPPHYVEFPWCEKYTAEMVMSSIRDINNGLAKHFPSSEGHRVFPVMGNHDNFPCDVLPPPEHGGSEWIDQFVDTWEVFNLPEESMHTARKGAFYTLLIEPGLRLVVINSVFCDFLNLYAHGYEGDIASQFAWLNTTLTDARNNGEKVLITAHISPGADVEPVTVTYRHYTTYCDEALWTVFDEFQDIIVASIYGHEHVDSFRIFHDRKTNQEPISVGYVTPGLDPLSNMNPCVRVFEYSKTTKQLTNYYQYFANLSLAITTGEIQWELEYEAKKEFKLRSMDAIEWQLAVDHMLMDENAYQRFRFLEFSSTPAETIPQCDGSCKRFQMCSILQPNWKEYIACCTNDS